jgi:hypothetical protein
MMHKVVFRKAIYFTEIGDYDNLASLRVEMNLPFVPYPGLKVTFGDGIGGEAVIESVTWFNDESYFYCETPAEVDRKQDLSFWLEAGWTLQGGKAQGVRLRT